MNKKIIIWIAVLVVALGGIFYAVDRSIAPTSLPEDNTSEIEKGDSGTEEEGTENDTNAGNQPAQAGCYVGGCSSQICSDDPGAISTCEFKEEYACYQNAKCERQASGQCGWTETPDLLMCLEEASN